MDGIAKLLCTDGYIMVNKALIKELGLHEAIILGELCSEYNYWKQQEKLVDGMFYSTRENIEDNTGLNEHYQRKAISTLKEFGILEVEKKGLPATNYYRIVFDKLLTMLSSSAPPRRELDVNHVNLNNNKQIVISNNLFVSKDTKSNFGDSNNFHFGNSNKTQAKQDKYTYQDCVSDIYQYTQDKELQECLLDYLNLRLSMKDKPMRLVQWKSLLKTLDKRVQESNKPAIEIVRHSINNGYATFYALKDRNYNKDKPWEDNVTCKRATQEEIELAHKQALEREANGQRGIF